MKFLTLFLAFFSKNRPSHSFICLMINKIKGIYSKLFQELLCILYSNYLISIIFHQIKTVVNTKLLISFFVSLILFSCGSSQEKTKEEYRTLFTTPKDTVIAKLRSAPQSFHLDTKKDTVIKGESGVKIRIAANVFVDAAGKPIENVDVELIEATNIESFIANDLMTVSGDSILESGGMFYINATSNGKPVSLKNNEALTLSVPSSGIIGNMNVFYGKYNDNGNLDWQKVENEENMEIDFNMTSVPIRYLGYEEMIERLEQANTFKQSLWAEEIRKLTDPKYEGTFIATKEFQSRLGIHLLGAYMDPDTNAFGDVMRIYQKHIDGNLWEADEEVITYLNPHYDDLMKRMNAENSDNTSDLGIGLAKAFKEFANLCWGILTSAPEAKYTRPINFNKLGISANTTKQDLIAKGMSPAEADRYLHLYSEFASDTLAMYNAIQTNKKLKQIKAYTVSISKLGWVNIDRFLNDPSCKESKLSVTVNGVDSTSTVKLMLVFPLRNICVQAINNEGNKYNFTTKNGMYRKLPIGEEAVIIGLSSADGKPYYGTTKIEIAESGEHTLELSETTMEGIKESLKTALKANKPNM